MYVWGIDFFLILVCFFRDSDIQDRCGPDASLYLSLERYIIVLLLVITLLSIAVILPVNYTAHNAPCGTYTVGVLDADIPI